MRRPLVTVVLVVVAAGCSGGSCSGVTPLVNGFTPSSRIENASSVRIMPSGLTFLAANFNAIGPSLLGLGGVGGVVSFNLPRTSENVTVTTATMCPNGSDPTSNPAVCVGQLDFGNANLTLTPTAPYDLQITGTVPLRIEDIQVEIPLTSCDPTLDFEITNGGTCGDTLYEALPVDVDLAIQVDSNANHTSRVGYTVVTAPQVVEASALTSNLDSNLAVCNDPSGGLCGSAVAGVLSELQADVVNQVAGQITSVLTTEIEGAVCQTATATVPCPAGSTADSSMICRFNNDPTNACVTSLLGSDGHVELGSLLQGVFGGAQGSLDFLAAGGGTDPNTSDPTMTLAWGDLDPVQNGVTLGMFGGAEANPISSCVPLATLALPTGILIPDELLGAGDAPADWPTTLPGPHVGVAWSERFANYALGSLYNSGFFCLRVATDTMPGLSSTTLATIAPSVALLGLQKEPQQVALVLRPSAPPTVTFGGGTSFTTDPTLLFALPQASYDFYIFSADRFIRFMTGTYDVSIPVNFTVNEGILTPVLGTLGFNSGVVTNTPLLAESPASLAAPLGTFLSTLFGQQAAASSLPVISGSSLVPSFGVDVLFPPGTAGTGSPGVQHLTKGTDNYLGIFADFALPSMMMSRPRPHPFATRSTTVPPILATPRTGKGVRR